MTDTTATKNAGNATFIFTMGLPAAGKSSAIETRHPDALVLDPDEMKKSIAGYDPKNPHAVHAQSQEIMEAAFENALLNGTGEIVVDGTGTNAEKMIRRIRQVRDAGHKATLLFVEVSLETSIRRNAARDRVVPENVIREKARDILTAFDLVSREIGLADVETFDNEAERS